MPHAIWKGAISFGLVHVPVSLYPASSDIGIDFDWLDKRSMDPVGYRRVNKKTGKEVAKDDIVKGVKVDDGRYVVLSEDQIRAAYPKTTQTIEIESFVRAVDIPFTLLEKPYYLEPAAKGERVYALLREAMLAAGVLGMARIVMHTKEYLAALIPTGPALMLNTLRWPAEMRPVADLQLPAPGRGALKAGELKMAGELIGRMTTRWAPDEHADRFTQAIQALVERRVNAGATERVEPMEDAVAPSSSNVVELTALLRDSLGRQRGSVATRAATKAAVPAPSKARSATKPVRKHATRR